MKSRSILTIGIALGASLFLAACSGTEETSSPETVTQTADQDATETTTANDTTTSEDTSADTTTSATDTTEQQNGDDPVFAAIDAVLAEHADGIIVDIDREDDREIYDIDVVVGNEVIELEVDGDGTIREDDREGDDDDVREAQDATVTAADAIRDALNQHPEGVLDEAQLDEDDGRLNWEIDLDDADRNDLAELSLPAN
ncbi:PepSY domain-containing protein [Corynebacterium halotolerans]|uniref:PepSY domain-containing protein n=1 Tax=Corynebacterium halotolerans TaxID=225326 RepID=UPI003CEF55C7